MCARTMLQWIRTFLRAIWMPCCQTYLKLRSPENTLQVMLSLCATPRSGYRWRALNLFAHCEASPSPAYSQVST